MRLTGPSRWALVFACLSVFGCAEEAPAEPTLRLGYSALRISLPVFVAEERGYFRDRGLGIELVRYETAQPLVEEVLDGRILAGGYAALPIVLTAAGRDGSETRLTTALVEDAEHPVSYLLRRRGDDSLRRVADLRGRNVGILPTVAYRRWLEVVLREGGVDPAEVRITPVSPQLQTTALREGVVDALFSNDPMATAAIAAGVAQTVGDAAPVPAAVGDDVLFGSFLVHPRLVRERPEEVAALAAALDDAIRWIHAHQAEARRRMIPYARPPERPHVGRYADARYLLSSELDQRWLEAEVSAQVRLRIVERPPPVQAWIVGTAGR